MSKTKLPMNPERSPRPQPKVVFNPFPPLWPESFTDAIAIDAGQDAEEITQVMIEVTEETAGIPQFFAEHLHVYSTDQEIVRLTVEKLREYGFPFIHCHIPHDDE